jgi:hypothetical protein
MGRAAPSVAKANIYDGLIMYGLKPVPFKSDRCQTEYAFASAHQQGVKISERFLVQIQSDFVDDFVGGLRCHHDNADG